MSWISDVKKDLAKLDSSNSSIKKFALSVGGLFLLIAMVALISKKLITLTVIVFGLIAAFLLLFGLTAPKLLKPIHKSWMGLAFAIGWIVSRILLAVIFYIVMAPLGALSVILGKDFLDIKKDSKRTTYWIKKSDKVIDYEKMY